MPFCGASPPLLPLPPLPLPLLPLPLLPFFPARAARPARPAAGLPFFVGRPAAGLAAGLLPLLLLGEAPLAPRRWFSRACWSACRPCHQAMVLEALASRSGSSSCRCEGMRA